MQSIRYLSESVQEDALKLGKMAFISGPRQVGKTTLAKALLESSSNFFTWDDVQFQKAWVKSPLAALAHRGQGPVLIDEIHKDRKWQSRLKGVFDLKGDQIPIIVTGSARLDLYRRGGESLLGRYLPYRLHPFSVGETPKPPAPFEGPPQEIGLGGVVKYSWSDLMAVGGFPEPLLRGSERLALRWSRLRRERLLGEDVRDIRAINDLNALKLLTELLPDRIGSLLSLNSLREDTGVAYATIRDWVQVLEAVYYCFLIRPYSGTMTRMLKAEPKLYLYDILQVTKESARLENLTALHLLKACHYWTDLAYGEFELSFVRTKEKKEVDFILLKNKKPWMLIECKSNSKTPSSPLLHFSRGLKCPYGFQLVTEKGYDRYFPESGIRVIEYEKFFSTWV